MSGSFPFQCYHQLCTATQWNASYWNARRLSFIPNHKSIDLLETKGRSSLGFKVRPLEVSTVKFQRMCHFLLFMNILPIQIYLFMWAFDSESLYCHWGYGWLLRRWPILKFSSLWLQKPLLGLALDKPLYFTCYPVELLAISQGNMEHPA